jgi:FixJ family two-component response regulator
VTEVCRRARRIADEAEGLYDTPANRHADIHDRIANGATQSEIARDLGISRQRVHQIVHDAARA